MTGWSKTSTPFAESGIRMYGVYVTKIKSNKEMHSFVKFDTQSEAEEYITWKKKQLQKYAYDTFTVQLFMLVEN